MPDSTVIKDFLMGFRKEIPPAVQYGKERKVSVYIYGRVSFSFWITFIGQKGWMHGFYFTDDVI